MIAGFIIGAFAVLPGVSGGVVAVLLGVYQKIIEAFNNFKCDKKNNVVFLTKTATFRPKGRYYAENVLKVCVKPIVSWINKMKDLANKDNEKYQQFLQDKRTRHNRIREYYKDLYDKQEDWW